MYSENYSTELENPRWEFDTHVKVHAMADKFAIENLSRLAITRYTELFHSWFFIESENGMKDMINALLASIPLIYSSTPETNRGLREVAIEFIRTCHSYLKKGDINETYFNEILGRVPSFAIDLIHDYMNLPIRVHCYACDAIVEGKVKNLECVECTGELDLEHL